MDALAAIRRYAFGFVNSHDFDVCRQLMSPDYTLHMGADVVRGRDEHYIPAVRHQMAQFPNLGFAIHDMLTDGVWTALCFSEHGTSAKDPGRAASWLGVSMYRFDGEWLTECWVEQDHYARRKQLAGQTAVMVPPVAVDPWHSAHSAPSAGVAEAVTGWWKELRTWPPPSGAYVIDPGPYAADQPRLEELESTLDVLVVSGDRAAFHATLRGRYTGGLPGFEGAGQAVEHHVAGFATTADGAVSGLRAVTHRVGVQRQLRPKHVPIS